MQSVTGCHCIQILIFYVCVYVSVTLFLQNTQSLIYKKLRTISVVQRRVERKEYSSKRHQYRNTAARDTVNSKALCRLFKDKKHLRRTTRPLKHRLGNFLPEDTNIESVELFFNFPRQKMWLFTLQKCIPFLMTWSLSATLCTSTRVILKHEVTLSKTDKNTSPSV